MKKQKSPMELSTGEELYDYLNGKTEQDAEQRTYGCGRSFPACEKRKASK